MRDSSTCNVVCLSPRQTYKLSHGCSRHGIPVMRLPEACHVVDFWYFLLSLSIVRTDPPTIPRVIQARHIYHKTSRSVQDAKLLLLQGTKTKGMILHPSKQLTIDRFVDADFAGPWNVENPHNPLCVKSQKGYVLMVGNCPANWVSKLLSEITVSTMEAEYIALSTAMHDLIPL